MQCFEKYEIFCYANGNDQDKNDFYQMYLSRCALYFYFSLYLYLQIVINLRHDISTEHIFSKINDMADVGITIHTFRNTNIQLCDVKFASLICIKKRALQ